MSSSPDPTASARIAAALLDLLAEEGEGAARARALEAAGGDEIALRQPGAWLGEERLRAAFAAAGLDRARARRVGLALVRPGSLGLPLRVAGVGRPEKAYRRCDALLAREGRGARYRALEIGAGSARVAFRPSPTRGGSAQPALCGVREGMLAGLAALFGLAPADVRETACSERGAPECVFEMSWRDLSHRGARIGAAAGALAGFALAAMLDTTWLGWVALPLVVGTLGAGTGRGFDLARQLAALARGRAAEAGLVGQVDQALAERMDALAKLDGALGDGAPAVEPAEELAAGDAPAARPARRREVADLAAIVEGAVSSLRPGWPAAVELALELGDAPATLHCDAFQIEQLVLQLLRNAADACESAGGGRVELRLRRVGDRHELCVRDDGAGIDEDLVDRVSDPFGPAPVAGVEGGFGLPVSLRIAEAHGGELHVESAPDRGSRISVWLPALPS